MGVLVALCEGWCGCSHQEDLTTDHDSRVFADVGHKMDEVRPRGGGASQHQKLGSVVGLR